MRRVVIREPEPESVQDETVYDVMIGAIGFEARSSFCLRRYEKRIGVLICFEFQDTTSGAHDDNARYARSVNAKIVSWQSSNGADAVRSVGAHLRQLISNTPETPRRLVSVGVDVSSMTREMSARVLLLLQDLDDPGCDYLVTILYAPANYLAQKEAISPITFAGPVVSELAGWSIYPESAVHAIVGLGYEYGRAVGALEYLDVSDVWLFVPTSQECRYERDTRLMNLELLSTVGLERTIQYEVQSPVDLFARLTSLVSGIAAEDRVVLIPFGPKIFSSLCIVLAMINRSRWEDGQGNRVAVWRVSGSDIEDPVDREASGSVIFFPFYLCN